MICEECEAVATESARGWLACRADEPEVDEEPELVFDCPVCAGREFGWRVSR
jgi:hypothetical protein